MQQRGVREFVVAVRTDLLGGIIGVAGGGAINRRIADVMPAAFIHDDGALLREAVQLEGGEEQMQDARVVGVLHILDIELPVVRQRLGEAPEHHGLAVAEHASDAAGDLFAKIIWQRGRVGAEGAVDEAADGLHPQLARAVVGDLEIRRHAALALDALLEGHARQVALQIIGPGVVDAGEALGCLALVVEADQRAAMGAAVLEGVDLARPVARDHHGGVAHEGGAPVAGVRHIAFKAQETPRRALKNPLLLLRVDVLALEGPEGHARQAFGPWGWRL